jgi:hypothetical protein
VFFWRAKKQDPKPMSGWIYAFETPSMPHIVKLGATSRDPLERLNEANACGTWRPPEPYIVAWAANVDAPFLVERRIHAALADRRIHPRREFFRVTPDEARAALALVAHISASSPAPLCADESYEAMKARFERTCFKTKTDKYPFHTVVEEGDIISRSKKAFTVAFEDWVRDGKQFLEAWYADPGKRSYKYIEIASPARVGACLAVAHPPLADGH